MISSLRLMRNDIPSGIISKTEMTFLRLTKIISGGQTGADRAALDFAIEFDIPYGDWISKGRKATKVFRIILNNSRIILDNKYKKWIPT